MATPNGTAKKAADNFKELIVIDVSDYIRHRINLKAKDGIVSLNIVEEHKAKKTGNWYLQCAIDIPLETYGESKGYQPMREYVDIFEGIIQNMLDFPIEGHPFYYLYSQKDPSTGKRKYEGFSDDPGQRKVY